MLQHLPTAMTMDKFVEYIKLVEPCLYQETWASEYIWEVLNYFDCPKEWREPVRVMAEGWSYYSADLWYAKYVDPSQRERYMDEYWDLA